MTFLILTVFFDLLGAGLLIPVIPYLVRQFRSDALTVGLLALAFSVAQFIAMPILGVLSDRWGRRPILILSVLGSAAGYYLFGVAGALWVMFAARLLDGFTGGNISTAQAYIADVTPPHERAKNMGLIGAAFGIGFILGPAAGGLLSHISLAAPAYAAAILGLGTAIFGYFVLPESLRHEDRTAGGFRASDLNPLGPLARVAGRVELRPLLTAMLIANFVMSGLQSNFAVMTLNRYGMSPDDNARIFAYLGVMAVLTQGVLVRRVTARFGDVLPLRAGMLIAALGYAAIALSFQPWLIYPAVGLIALGTGLANPTLMSLISRRGGPRDQGALLGSAQAVGGLGRIAGPIWAGALFDALGYATPYWSSFVFMLLLVPVLAREKDPLAEDAAGAAARQPQETTAA